MKRKAHVEFYSRSDLKDLFEAIEFASSKALDTMPPGLEVAVYMSGVRNTLQSLAIAVGVDLALSSNDPIQGEWRIFKDEDEKRYFFSLTRIID